MTSRRLTSAGDEVSTESWELHFGSGGEVFGDRIIATAILDRLLHHAITVSIRGQSYRLKEKLKAGLVKCADALP